MGKMKAQVIVGMVSLTAEYFGHAKSLFPETIESVSEGAIFNSSVSPDRKSP